MPNQRPTLRAGPADDQRRRDRDLERRGGQGTSDTRFQLWEEIPGGGTVTDITCTTTAGSTSDYSEDLEDNGRCASGRDSSRPTLGRSRSNARSRTSRPAPGTITARKGGLRNGQTTSLNTISQPLTGASFEFSPEGQNAWQPLCGPTNASGLCTSGPIAPGDYDVRELASPAGWTKITDTSSSTGGAATSSAEALHRHRRGDVRRRCREQRWFHEPEGEPGHRRGVRARHRALSTARARSSPTSTTSKTPALLRVRVVTPGHAHAAEDLQLRHGARRPTRVRSSTCSTRPTSRRRTTRLRASTTTSAAVRTGTPGSTRSSGPASTR